jgi:hypothetical protein
LQIRWRSPTPEIERQTSQIGLALDFPAQNSFNMLLNEKSGMSE